MLCDLIAWGLIYCQGSQPHRQLSNVWATQDMVTQLALICVECVRLPMFMQYSLMQKELDGARY